MKPTKQVFNEGPLGGAQPQEPMALVWLTAAQLDSLNQLGSEMPNKPNKDSCTAAEWAEWEKRFSEWKERFSDWVFEAYTPYFLAGRGSQNEDDYERWGRAILLAIEKVPKYYQNTGDNQLSRYFLTSLSNIRRNITKKDTAGKNTRDSLTNDKEDGEGSEIDIPVPEKNIVIQMGIQQELTAAVINFQAQRQEFWKWRNDQAEERMHKMWYTEQALKWLLDQNPVTDENTLLRVLDYAYLNWILEEDLSIQANRNVDFVRNAKLKSPFYPKIKANGVRSLEPEWLENGFLPELLARDYIATWPPINRGEWNKCPDEGGIRRSRKEYQRLQEWFLKKRNERGEASTDQPPVLLILNHAEITRAYQADQKRKKKKTEPEAPEEAAQMQYDLRVNRMWYTEITYHLIQGGATAWNEAEILKALDFQYLDWFLEADLRSSSNRTIDAIRYAKLKPKYEPDETKEEADTDRQQTQVTKKSKKKKQSDKWFLPEQVALDYLGSLPEVEQRRELQKKKEIRKSRKEFMQYMGWRYYRLERDA